MNIFDARNRKPGQTQVGGGLGTPMAPPQINPVLAPVKSYLLDNRWYQAPRPERGGKHPGIDFLTNKPGTPVYAIQDGVVHADEKDESKSGWQDNFYAETQALRVDSYDTNGVLAEQFTYGEIATLLRPGDSIKQGQIVGYMEKHKNRDGATMLHLEYRVVNTGGLVLKDPTFAFSLPKHPGWYQK